MDKVAKLPAAERRELFEQTANNRGVSFQIIEKDFWVCWTLKRLFSLPEIGSHLIFKGGTSLSKVYGIIERFSEDIDIAINKDFLGYLGDEDFKELSNNQKNKKIEELDEACKELVQGEIRAALSESFKSNLEDTSWTLETDPADPYGQTLLFAYPREARDANSPLSYIRPVVKIELGARPENQPVEKHLVMPYAAEEFPGVFEEPSYELTVLSAERTFWEKATILHDQYHREDSYKTADRISRHYYDLFKMIQAGIAERAIENPELLKSVVENKVLFFYRAGAKYEEALSGNLRLSPSDSRLPALKADYEKMGAMFFIKPPALDKILEALAKVEQDINSRINGRG